MEPAVAVEPLTRPAGARPRGRGASAPPRWQSAEVLEVLEEAPDTVTLRLGLEVVDGFLPGQYYNVRLPVPGRPRPVQRAYSVGSSPLPDPSVIDIGVRGVPGGLVSPRLLREFPAGSRIEVRGPVGRFTWTGEEGGPLLLVGAGSGMVPLVSMVRFGVEAGLEVPTCVLGSAASFEYALYRHDLSRLAAGRPWLRVVHTFTRDPDDPRAAYHRRIDRDLLAEVLEGGVPRWAYLCGPPGMVEATAAHLEALGLEPARIRTEKYD